MGQVLLAAPRAYPPVRAELRAPWAGAGSPCTALTYDNGLPALARLVSGGEDVDAALLVGPPRRAPGIALPAPFAVDRRGRRVPLAWLPATGAEPLRRFARTAARVHRRGGGGAAVALLGQWHPAYLKVTARMEALLRPEVRTFRWTGDAITREGLVEALGTGLGLGLYVGHGRPVGWVGYHGTRRHHLDPFPGEPIGALLSLCCRTASRRRTALSFAEALPLQGVAAACFGATSDTLHTDNTRWALAVCDALRARPARVGELLARAAPPNPGAIAPYRLIGDPLAPIGSSAEALSRAGSVPVLA